MDAQRVDAERVLESLPDPAERREMLRRVVLNFPLVAELEPASVLRALDVAGVRVYCENGQVLRIEP